MNGVPQDSIDGVSFAYSFDDPTAEGRLQTQYFEILGCRGIYHQGWMASTFGPRVPWVRRIAARHPRVDPGQGHLGAVQPRRGLEPSQRPRSGDARKARAPQGAVPDRSGQERRFPIGGGLWIPLFHPELRPAPPYTEWTFFGDTVRVPEFSAPALGTRPNVVTIDATIPADANGVLYKLGGFPGGVTCFVEDGILCYEYNLFEIQRTKIRAHEKLPPGKVKIEIETNHPRAHAARAPRT